MVMLNPPNAWPPMLPTVDVAAARAVCAKRDESSRIKLSGVPHSIRNGAGELKVDSDLFWVLPLKIAGRDEALAFRAPPAAGVEKRFWGAHADIGVAETR